MSGRGRAGLPPGLVRLAVRSPRLAQAIGRVLGRLHRSSGDLDDAPLEDYWLFRALHQELPVLSDPAAGDLERVEAIRTWVCENIARAPRESPCQVSSPEFAGWQDRPVGQSLHWLATANAAAMCGGTAHVLLRVCRLLGYEGFVYGFGEPASRLTHVVTVVRVPWRGKSVFSVQDAHFNLTIVDEAGRPVDFFRLLQRVEKGAFESLTVSHGAGGEHAYVSSPPPDYTAPLRASGPMTDVGTVVHKFPNLEKWIAGKPIDKLAPGLGFPANFLSLLSRGGWLGYGHATSLRRRSLIDSMLNGRRREGSDEGARAAHGARIVDGHPLAAADYWLRRYLTALLAPLGDPHSTALARAHALRQFVFRTVNRSPRHSYLQLADRWDDYYQRSAPELLREFLSHGGSAMCHGNAYTLLRVYDLFGFSSFIYNMGVSEGPLTHAVTVVTVPHDGQNVAVIEDSHFGMTLECNSGGPLNFWDLLARLRKRQDEGIQMSLQQELIVPYILPEGHRSAGDETLATTPSQPLGSGHHLVHQQVSLNRWTTRRDLPSALSDLGLPPSFLYLYALPLGVFTDGGSESEQAIRILTRINEVLAGPASRTRGGPKAPAGSARGC